MTQRIRTNLADIHTLADNLPGPLHPHWPDRIHRITTHIERHLDDAIRNLIGTSDQRPDGWTLPENPNTTPRVARPGEARLTPMEAAATIRSRQTGRVQETTLEISSEITLAIAHLTDCTTGHHDTPTQRNRAEAAHEALKKAARTIDKWATPDKDKRDLLLCNGLHLAGVAHWGTPECTNIASANGNGHTDKLGLCIECHPKYIAWNSRDWRARRKALVHA